jgi:DNA-binding beta-propeller fold protein YncE
VAVDRKGDVAVGEFANGDILEFPAGTTSPSVTITLLTLPEGQAFDRSGRLNAAWNESSGSGLAGHVSTCEKMRAVCSDRGIVQGQSGGLALDRAGNLLLGDQTNAAVNVYARKSSTPSRSISMSGHDPYKFELDKSEKNLYVADITTGMVLIYDYQTGVQLGTISSGLQSAWGVSLSPAAKDGP